MLMMPSLSARRAWIEIVLPGFAKRLKTSLSARRAWIEICTAETDITLIGRSLSARRAWIEITYFSIFFSNF